MKKKSKYLLMDEIGKRFLTVDEVLIPVHFFFVFAITTMAILKNTVHATMHEVFLIKIKL